MRLIFLGSGGSWPTPERGTTALYLPDHGLLLDAGTNVHPLRDLHGEGPLDVLLSHYHVDHSVGLFTLSGGLFYGRSEPESSASDFARGTRYGELWPSGYGT